VRQFPDAAFTPHQAGKVLTRSAGAVADALDKLVPLGVAQPPARPRRPAQVAVGDPGVSAEAAPSAA
jgi:hypothetical protein